MILRAAAYQDLVHEPVTGAMEPATLVILQFYHQGFTHILCIYDICIFLVLLKIIEKPLIQDNWLSSSLGA